MIFSKWSSSRRCCKCGAAISSSDCGTEGDDCPLIQARAIRWFVLLRSDGCAEAWKQGEVEEFQIWVNANPAHYEAYRKVEKFWMQCGAFADEPEIRARRRKAL